MDKDNLLITYYHDDRIDFLMGMHCFGEDCCGVHISCEDVDLFLEKSTAMCSYPRGVWNREDHGFWVEFGTPKRTVTSTLLSLLLF